MSFFFGIIIKLLLRKDICTQPKPSEYLRFCFKYTMSICADILLTFAKQMESSVKNVEGVITSIDEKSKRETTEDIKSIVEDMKVYIQCALMNWELQVSGETKCDENPRNEEGKSDRITTNYCGKRQDAVPNSLEGDVQEQTSPVCDESTRTRVATNKKGHSKIENESDLQNARLNLLEQRVDVLTHQLMMVLGIVNAANSQQNESNFHIVQDEERVYEI
ncbi:Uncharacterised protein at_DN2468 [Pycnogonum litorale]